MRWKPNRFQRDEYARRCQEAKENHIFIESNGPIRKGCFVKYFSVNKNCVIEGEVTNDSYGSSQGQHTFTIDSLCVKGRNLYPWLIEHKPGEKSKHFCY